MFLKALIIFAAAAAAVQAGGPASYAISAPSLDHYSVGSSNEHTVKGLYGQNVLSTYSKAVDTPHSSVRVHNSKASNDLYGHNYGYGAPLAYGGHYGHAVAPLAAHHVAASPYAYHGAASPYAYHGVASPYAYHGAAAAVAPLAYHGGYAGYHGAAAPLLKAPLVAAHAPVSTVSFHGLGAHYAW